MSASYSTHVLVAVDGKLNSASIGSLIDSYLPPILSRGQHDVMPVSNLKCPGVSSTERVAWANVTHVSRHPANGDMLTVTTERGRTLKMTASHSFLVRDKNRVVQRTGSDLVLGDSLPIVKDLPSNGGQVPDAPLTRASGLFIGAIVSDGVSEVGQHDESEWLADWMADNSGRTSKTLPAWILDAPDEFVAGLLQAYFDEDGNVQPDGLCCHSVSADLVTMLCLCLARFGIVTYVGTAGAAYRITIPMCFAAKFQEHIGFTTERKAEKLAEVIKEGTHEIQAHIPGMDEVLEEVRSYIPHGYIPHSCENFKLRNRKITAKMLMRCREHAVKFNAPDELLSELDQAIHADVWWDPIVSIDIEEDSQEMVYDFTVDVSLQSFMLANGVFVHNTLNTFHSAGIGSQLTFGVPRFKALIDLSKGTGAMRLSLKQPFCKDRAKATSLAHAMVHTRLVDIVESTTLLLDKDPSSTDVQSDELLVRLHALTEGVPAACGEWVARMVLNRSRMAEQGITPPKVYDILTSLHPEMHFCASETNALEWVVRARLRGEDTSKLSLQKAHAEMLETTLAGIRRIGRATCNESEVSTRPGKAETQFIIETTGVAVYSLVNCPAVDLYSSTLNDLHETHSIFGIEACTATLFREIRMTITYDGTYVDDRHIGAIANTMTFRGELMSFTRHGINRVDQGPLLRSSFEETVDNMSEAAMFNESDVGCGVTQSVIFGQIARIGTGMCSVRTQTALPPPPVEQVAKPALRKSRMRHVDNAQTEPSVQYMMWKTKGDGEKQQQEAEYRPPSP